MYCGEAVLLHRRCVEMYCDEAVLLHRRCVAGGCAPWLLPKTIGSREGFATQGVCSKTGGGV